jgi:hypothetical protein
LLSFKNKARGRCRGACAKVGVSYQDSGGWPLLSWVVVTSLFAWVVVTSLMLVLVGDTTQKEDNVSKELI